MSVHLSPAQTATLRRAAEHGPIRTYDVNGALGRNQEQHLPHLLAYGLVAWHPSIYLQLDEKRPAEEIEGPTLHLTPEGRAFLKTLPASEELMTAA